MSGKSAEQELKELREQNEKLTTQLAEKDKEIDSLLDTPLLPDGDVFPGNIKVLKLVFDENKIPTHYEEIEVPEEAANEQLDLPPNARNSHWKHICRKENADPRFLA